MPMMFLNLRLLNHDRAPNMFRLDTMSFLVTLHSHDDLLCHEVDDVPFLDGRVEDDIANNLRSLRFASTMVGDKSRHGDGRGFVTGVVVCSSLVDGAQRGYFGKWSSRNGGDYGCYFDGDDVCCWESCQYLAAMSRGRGKENDIPRFSARTEAQPARTTAVTERKCIMEQMKIIARNQVHDVKSDKK